LVLVAERSKMIKFLSKKNNYDFIHQFQWIKGCDKPKFKVLYYDTNNNDIVKQNNLIFATYYSLLLHFNQKPLIKTTKKSIASFGIRPNMNLGVCISINENSLFWNTCFYYINSSLPLYKNNIAYNTLNSFSFSRLYNVQVNYGISNISSRIMGISHYNASNNIGGGNFTFNFTSPVKFVPFFYLP
jgi:ribosomal protein L5